MSHTVIERLWINNVECTLCKDHELGGYFVWDEYNDEIISEGETMEDALEEALTT
jgi:hypothetical protein